MKEQKKRVRNKNITGFEKIENVCYFHNYCKYIMLGSLFFCLFLMALIVIPKINLFSIAGYDSNFNLNVEILDKYKEVFPGEEVWFSIALMNLNIENRQDVILKYKIIASKNHEEIVSKTETVAVETSNSFVRSLELPKNIPPKSYVVSVKASYTDGTIGVAEEPFIVLETKKTFDYTFLVYLVIFIIVVIVMIRLIVIVLKLRKAVEELKNKKK
jgi:hypothetical protein